MQTIHKYPIPIADEFALEIPHRAKVLCVQVQRDEPFIWALVDDATSLKSTYTFLLRGTGHNCEDIHINRESYIGTFQLHGGNIVFHLFSKNFLP